MHAARVARYMRREAGIGVETDSGGKMGELTVWVGGKLVGQKEHFLKFPGKEKMLAAVREALATDVTDG